MLIEKESYTAELNETTGKIEKLFPVTDVEKHNVIDEKGHFGSLCFTYKDETPEIIERYAGKGKTYILKDHYALFNKIENSEFSFENEEHNSTLNYVFSDDAITLTLNCHDCNLSQVGLSLDVDMIDKDQNGDFNTQFLPVCPYASEDGKLKFYAMARPDGLWILFLALSESAGWRIVYGKDNAHILDGFQFLSEFDERLTERRNKEPLKIRVSFHTSLDEILKTVKTVTGAELPRSLSYGAAIGEKVYAFVGDNKTAVLKSPDGETLNLEVENNFTSFVPKKSGFYTLTVGKSIKSIAKYFVYQDIEDLFIRSTDAIKEPYHCDFNLCEGAMWLWALLLRKKLFGSAGKNEFRIKEFFEQNTKVTKENVTDADIGKIVSFPHEFTGQHCSEYHLYKLNRIQNAIVQSEIMLEAWHCYGDEKYLKLSTEYLKNIIRDHLNENGALVCDIFGENSADYTTVTACIIGFVDLHCELTLLGKDEADEFKQVSVKIADYLVRRGFNFPTEGTAGRHEMEDGSISCTSLSLLYAYLYVEQKSEYLSVAKQMLLFHDSWCMELPDARQNGSTLRWWETNWEGDADGSGINAGHAWTIWKAEADYLYAYITGDFNRLIRSYNGYVTNFAKVREDGRMYTCFTPDYVTSQPFKIKHNYPDLTDGSMPYYVWTRCGETWFVSSAVYGDENGIHCLNGRIDNSGSPTLESAALSLQRLFLGADVPQLTVNTEKTLEIICGQKINCSVITGTVKSIKSGKLIVEPKNGKIVIGE